MSNGISVRDNGGTYAWQKYQDAPWVLHPSCYDSLRAAWMKGEAFYTGKDLWGDEVTLKLADVTGVSARTAAGIMANVEGGRRDVADDKAAEMMG